MATLRSTCGSTLVRNNKTVYILLFKMLFYFLNITVFFTYYEIHLWLSVGEKPYECPDCHERFARNSTLKCHMAACQNGAGAKKGRKKLYECQVAIFHIQAPTYVAYQPFKMTLVVCFFFL